MNLITSRNERNKTDPYFISHALSESSVAFRYRITQQLSEMYTDKYILSTQHHDFDVYTFAKEKLCEMRARPDLFVYFNTAWDSDEKKPAQHLMDGWFEIVWHDQKFELLIVTVLGQYYSVRHSWLISASQETAESFFAEVFKWNQEAHHEVLVFDDDMWRKDARLYESIKAATFDNLVLPSRLKEEIYNDLVTFFNSREVYENFGVPWRRGLLLLGPPGNGKTHAVKALINALGKPCLYVKSIGAENNANRASIETNIRHVFERARATKPCILVFEDLDSMITKDTRSLFLNELDGFIDNSGIVTLATTNHPEKLDSAIIDRPSRFDRKYHFELPGQTERVAYLKLWNADLQNELRLSESGIDEIASLTDGFSFAYLKELIVSSITAWMARAKSGEMDSVMKHQARLLHEQMVSTANAEKKKNDDVKNEATSTDPT
jgi:AAA+ superfamily predicted ATPase